MWPLMVFVVAHTIEAQLFTGFEEVQPFVEVTASADGVVMNIGMVERCRIEPLGEVFIESSKRHPVFGKNLHQSSL